jgi:hypothetical protein
MCGVLCVYVTSLSMYMYYVLTWTSVCVLYYLIEYTCTILPTHTSYLQCQLLALSHRRDQVSEFSMTHARDQRHSDHVHIRRGGRREHYGDEGHRDTRRGGGGGAIRGLMRS